MKKILLFFLFCLSPLFAEQGKLIVLYGTPCAGKSTLTKKLEEILPGHFKGVKRTHIAHRLRLDNLEEITGVRPKNLKEAAEIEKNLPKKNQRNFSHDFKEMALSPMIQEMEQRLAKGENLIFDVCLYHKEQLDQMQYLNPSYVLVYSPIADLSKREQERAATRDFTQTQHNNTRKFILSGFSRLYHPVSTSESVDTISKDEVVDYYLTSRNTWTNDGYSRIAQHVITQFHLKPGQRVGFAPNRKPTLFINSSQLSPTEGSTLIKQHIESL